MKILTIINNHNSYSLLDLCVALYKIDSSIRVHIVGAHDQKEALSERCSKFSFMTFEIWEEIPTQNLKLGNRFLTNNNVNYLESAKNIYRKLLKNELSKFLVKSLFTTSIGFIFIENYIYLKLQSKKLNARRIFINEEPQVVFSMSDRTHDYIESSILWEAKRSGVLIFLPYVAHYDKKTALGYRRDSQGKLKPEFSVFREFNLYKLWHSLFFRKTLFQGSFFQDVYVLKAHHRNGSLSKYPWWIGNGLSDVVCISSLNDMGIYQNNRVNPKKLFITGHVQYDSVYDGYINKKKIKEKYINDYSLDAKKEIVVVALPPYYEQGFMNSRDHWHAINEIIEILVRQKCNVLISLHPRVNKNQYIFLEARFPGCFIAKERLYKFISIADIFIAAPSTTVAWACLCGVQTIVLDLLCLNKKFYEYLSSVSTIENIDEIEYLIKELLIRKKTFNFEQDWKKLSRDIVFTGEVARSCLDIINSKITN
jgi:hypothetical protein